MLAYVFWHRPRADVSTTEYEVRLRAFHDSLDVPSASFRLGELPFAPDSGYEDWYIVDAWSELGELNANAVAREHRQRHAAIAELAGEGWGGVYALVRGEAQPPPAARWVSKPAGMDYEAFVGSLTAPTVWQRQLVLGPGAEFCLVEGEQAERTRV